MDVVGVVGVIPDYRSTGLCMPMNKNNCQQFQES